MNITDIISGILRRILPHPPRKPVCRDCAVPIEPGEHVGAEPLCIVCAESEGRGDA
jgi:hypothetical protein